MSPKLQGLPLQLNVLEDRFAPAAHVASISVNQGTVQRSMVTELAVTFDSSVTFAGNAAAAFSLVNQRTSTATTLAVTLDNTGTLATVTFPTGIGHSLSDGRYTLKVLASQFTGDGLDGNNDGFAGDDFTEVGAQAFGHNLFRLFGDAEGNGIVDQADFMAYANNLSLGPIFDFDGNGQTNQTDFIQFRNRFNLMV